MLFKIPKTLMHRLEGGAAERFAQSAVLHIRQHHADLCRHRDDAALRHHVDAMLVFCRAYAVVQQPNVLRMLDSQMREAWAPPLSGYLAWRLGQPGFDEGLRVANFEQALMQSEHPELIALNSVIDLPRHA